MSHNGKPQDDSRWQGIDRVYTPEDVARLRGTVTVEHTLARLGAERLWALLAEREHVPTLGALTGGQAVQMVKAGLEAIYVSGWQVAADANLAGATYPDQSLYPVNSVPALVRRLNNALLRADQIHAAEGDTSTHWLAPIVADAEAGFGGPLNAYELMKAMIEAGAAGVHFEDQLASEKKCGHLGGKVLVPTGQFVRTLNAARLAADVCGVPTVLIARTDALSATLLTSDADPADAEFLTGERTPEGFFRVRDGMEPVVARSLAYAPYADILWFETSTPDLEEARTFAEAIHDEFPSKLLGYNCSPSFNWRSHLEDAIVSGEIPPGTVLRQEQLSEQFDVSRTPVREALRRLAATGLVSFVPNRGVRVREISRGELREAFLIRAELEALATELATPRMTADDLVALEQVELRFAELTAALLDRSRGETERFRLTGEWMRANYAFHDVIYAAAGAPMVARAAKSARRTFLSQWRPGGPEIDELYEQNVRQHRAIRDAIAAGSAAGARAVAHEHVLHSCRMLELILDHVTAS